MRPMLDDLELPLVQEIITHEQRALTEHKPPGMDGSLLQNMGRRPASILIRGFASGADSLSVMEKLNDKFHAGESVSFIADIVSDATIEKILIEDLRLLELAGKPEHFEYSLTLREYIEPPPVFQEEPPPPPPTPPLPPVDKGVLIVEVVVEGQPEFDYSMFTVTVEGTEQDGTPLSRSLTDQSPTWTDENLPPGQYTVKVKGPEPQAVSQSTEATVRAGEQTKITVAVNAAAPPSDVAKTFIVHFRMDNAFVEPAMRDVLTRVAQYAAEHPAEKLIILGHTDLVGSPEYNQKLSERRARSVYSFLTYGRDDNARNEAVEEWNTLRQQADQSVRDIQDNWGTSEYQFMLQGLSPCYYNGNIDGNHGSKTAEAISTFQEDKGLPTSGVMDDTTWWALIEQYLAEPPLSIPENQFFPNSKDGCEGGILKWLGAGEQDPVKNIEDAWRPNRRTELLFIQAEQIPCEVPKPRSLEKLTPGGAWCLGTDINKQPEASIKRVEFLTRKEAQPNKWLVHPAEPGQILINGTITRDTDDGPGVANAKYALIAPDGTYLHTGANGNPDLGERPQGDQRGQPIPNRADENGAFSYPEPTPEGTYTLELLGIDDPAVARWKRPDKDWDAKGSIVFHCLLAQPALMGKALAEEATLGADVPQKTGAVVEPNKTEAPQAKAKFQIADPPVVVVRKSYTNPARRKIILSIDVPSSEKWILTCSGNNIDGIRLYKELIGGEPLKCDGQDLKSEFDGSRLYWKPHITLYVAGISPSKEMDDYEITLSPKPKINSTSDPTRFGKASLTAVMLTLDICAPRPALGKEPPLLPEPPDPPPPAGTGTDKWYGGRLLNVQDSGNNQERAILIVKVQPYISYDIELILRQVQISGNKITTLDNKTHVTLFDDEIPGSKRQPPVSTESAYPDNPLLFKRSTLNVEGVRYFFVEGKAVSNTERDTGLQLGIKLDGSNVENDGDRVALSVGVGAVITLDSPIVVVRKTYTNPVRRIVTLRTSTSFNRSGILTATPGGPPIRLFDREREGNEIVVTGAGHTFSGAELSSSTGVRLFAESIAPSGAKDDFELNLTLEKGTQPPVGTPAKVKMTAVELTMDVALSRTAPGATPPLMSADDKINMGRFIQLRDPGFSYERSMIIMRPPNPSIPLTIVLTSINAEVQAFGDEKPAASQSPQPSPLSFPSALLSVTSGGRQLFVEGTSVSSAVRDTGFRYGIEGLEKEADCVAMTVLAATISSVTLLGENQVVDISFTTSPTPLPAGCSITLELITTNGIGESVFSLTNTKTLNVDKTTTVMVRGVTGSSVLDNISLTARVTGQPQIFAQEDFSVVAVAITPVAGVNMNQTLDIPIFISPSSLPPGSSVTLELKTKSGIGEARFSSNNSNLATITQTTTVSVRGIMPSTDSDNICLTAKITGTTDVLAQENFTVLGVNIFIKFEIWNLTSKKFESLPDGIDVDVMDYDPTFINPDDRLATHKTDKDGRVHFGLPNFEESGEQAPDLYFLIHPRSGSKTYSGYNLDNLPDEWSTKGWKATDGSPGYFENYNNTPLGTQTKPLTYRIGMDIHVKLQYLDESKLPAQYAIAPKGIPVSLHTGIHGSKIRQMYTESSGETHGVVFDVSGGDSITIRVRFELQEDNTINMKIAKIWWLVAWDTFENDNQMTSIGTQSAPKLLNADPDDRNMNAALYFLKNYRELSSFLYHITGGAWAGFKELTFYRSTIGTWFSSTPHSWPIGSVIIPPKSDIKDKNGNIVRTIYWHWKRGTIIHEITHQIMWQEVNYSTLGIAYEAIAGQYYMGHRQDFFANTEHALIEGWAEFLEGVFMGGNFTNVNQPPWNVAQVIDEIPTINNPNPPTRPLTNSDGESVEGAFANGLWCIFQNCVLGSGDAHVPESINGDIMTTPAGTWLGKPDVKSRFLSIIWQPMLDLKPMNNPTTTDMIRNIYLRNRSQWGQIQIELNKYNMAMSPLLSSIFPVSGSATGNQSFTLRGSNFVSDIQVSFIQATTGPRLAIDIKVVNQTTITGKTPAGVVGPADVSITAFTGTDKLPAGYAYV